MLFSPLGPSGLDKRCVAVDWQGPWPVGGMSLCEVGIVVRSGIARRTCARPGCTTVFVIANAKLNQMKGGGMATFSRREQDQATTLPVVATVMTETTIFP